ncbi:acetyl-CoA acyltransferase [Cricetibacter osteomyelitidis]|uniref:Acetyl-CoA acyltransferase n=1 Tax=Cricetibacter osteomyelitidis TaxID=1521931 RepID=A0A4R2T3C0_9PAST|nr:acetyl-CoA C-acyltransferase [Cricetibacter osteomyelitidis]TCP96485.1 acetyl-CoA acyltransferase [Cricetibacter osteomyelitidis]
MATEQNLVTSQGQRIAIVAGLRTPFTQKDTGFKDAYAIDLGTMVTNELLNRVGIDRTLIQQLIFGQVTQHADIQNISRGIAINLGLAHTQAYTISSSCVTGLQTVANLTSSIVSGSVTAGIAGGADSVSNSSISLNSRMMQRLKDILNAQGVENKYELLKQLSLDDLKPHSTSQKDYITDLSVADVSEQMAKNFGISRQEQDEYTARSHRLIGEAWLNGNLRDEVMISFPPPYENFVVADNLFETSLKSSRYGKFQPVADKKYGSVTDWNTSKGCDGAGAVMLMREDIAKAQGLTALGYIRSYAMTGNDVWDNMLSGMTYASSLALLRADVSVQDINLIDFHESSAAQVLANLCLFESDEFAREKLNRTSAIGAIDMDKFNVLGGSLGIGNPRAVTGIRVLIQNLFELQRRGGGLGLVACSGLGGLGAAMVLETE